jgi:hypothetical protein
MFFIETEEGEFVNAHYITKLSAQSSKQHDPEGTGRLMATMADGGYYIRLGRFSTPEKAQAALGRLIHNMMASGSGYVPFIMYDTDVRKWRI